MHPARQDRDIDASSDFAQSVRQRLGRSPGAKVVAQSQRGRLIRWLGGVKEHNRYSWPVEVLFALSLAALIAVAQLWVDGQRAERQEVLANVSFIRETLRDDPEGARNFRGMNLRGADLSALDLGCDISIGSYTSGGADSRVIQELDETPCSDFTGADLTGAKLDKADLTGAILDDVVLDDIHATGVSLAGSSIRPNVMRNVQFDMSDLRDVRLDAAMFSSDARSMDLILRESDITYATLEGRIQFIVQDVRGYDVVLLDGAAVTCPERVDALKNTVEFGSDMKVVGRIHCGGWSTVGAITGDNTVPNSRHIIDRLTKPHGTND